MPSRHGRQPPPAPQARPQAHTPAPPQPAPIQPTRLDSRALPRDDLLQLHRTLGNRPVAARWPPAPPGGPGPLPADREPPQTTGVPEALKAEIEALSVVSLDDV